MTKDEALKLLEKSTRNCNNIDEQRALDALLRAAQQPKGLFIDLIAAQGEEFVAEIAAIKVQEQEPVNNKPLPCPFCGHTGLNFLDGSTHRWGIASCETCGASCGEVRREYPDDGAWHKKAIFEWNQRTTPPAAQPAQEPHSYCYVQKGTSVDILTFDDTPEDAVEGTLYPLYTTPPAAQPAQELEPDELTIAYMSGLLDGKKKRPWVDLTHQQTKDCMAAWDGKDAYVLCRAIESKLEEANT